MNSNFTRHVLCCLLLLLCVQYTFAQPANDNCADGDTVLMNIMVPFSTLGASTDGPFHPNSPCPSSASDSIFSDVWFVHVATLTGELRWSLCGMADYDSRIAVYNGGASCPLTDADLLNCNEDGPAACTNFESELDFDVVAGEAYILRVGGFGAEEPGAQGTGSFIITEVPPGPPNDDCVDAIPIDLGEDQMVSNENADTDGPVHPNDNICFGFGDNTAQNDIWYTFTSPITGTVEWSTCSQVNWDSRLVVYGPNVSCMDASPDNTIACSDATAGCANFTNILQFDAVEGVTYLLRVGGYNGATGTGIMDLIEIDPPKPPGNDLCDFPDTSFVMSPYDADNFEFLFTGTLINASVSPNIFDPSCGNGQGGKFPDVWYKFNNLGNETLELRYFAETPGTGFFMEIFESCEGDTIPAGSSCFFYTQDDTDILVDSIFGLSPTPTEYLIRVNGWLYWPTGPFFFQLVGDPTVDNKEVLFPGQVNLAPNPVSDLLQLNLNMHGSSDDTRVQIVNILGQVVDEKVLGRVIPGEITETFDTSGLNGGIYTLVVRADESRKAIKFTKL